MITPTDLRKLADRWWEPEGTYGEIVNSLRQAADEIERLTHEIQLAGAHQQQIASAALRHDPFFDFQAAHERAKEMLDQIEAGPKAP